MVRIGSARQFWSGVMFAAIGVAFAWGARRYDFGSSSEPGPGYFPSGLGALLALLGLASVLRSLRARSAAQGAEAPIGRPAWRPLLVVCGSIAVFAWTLPRFGLVVALPLVVVLSAMASPQFRWRDALLNATVLTAGSWAIFVWGLDLPLPLWPSA